MSTLRRPRLAQAPIHELWLDEQWQQDERYRLQPWFRWGWCRLDEVVELVNKYFAVRWTRVGLLQRFAIPREQGSIKFGSSNKERNFDLRMLWVNEANGELLCEHFCGQDFGYAREWNIRVPYVPAGWVKDVLWALYGGCTRAIRKSNGEKVACMEDGTPVFAMTGAGKTH